MFSISTLTDVVRIPPKLFGESLRKASITILREKYESMINPELGYVIMILDTKVEKMGKIIAGDGGTYHRVEFSALTFYPKLQEIVRGEIVEITDFGAFVRIGATDALLHLSQIMDDYLKSDVKSGMVLANQSGRTMKIGTTLRARITAVSLGKTAAMKVGITCRQPFLGADEWIEEEIKKSKSAQAQSEKAKSAQAQPEKTKSQHTQPEKPKKTVEAK
ncbi:MAG: DNA-directed RNA polymerase [Thaumarchaeota archaeon 13_1_40CM_38_12]|nr:MAG: DNA-directed RNA polymerase [Thaumarchaeota archaeon 13_1_40CM_38_12]OLC35486.1 MAG: DNA-directed RNA polymerase [Thaumarchaeota archaeon 13_1_40CM_4_38_7]OLC91412.1 MAG: DNA-directed RNA polymerase [Thaumarchaeota archaeon 13_1_40CM_3_38_6]